MWKGVPGHLLMAENKLQEKVLGSMPRLAWEYRNIPSNSDSPLPLKERTLEGFRGGPCSLCWKKMAEEG